MNHILLSWICQGDDNVYSNKITSVCVRRLGIQHISHIDHSFILFFYIYIFLRLLLHVNHVQPVCTFLSRTVMLILIFNSTAYCHAHKIYFIFYILFFISFFFFCYQQFFIFIFSQTTQHNIQNKTKQNSRHILNISRFNQKGGREGRTTRTQKLLL